MDHVAKMRKIFDENVERYESWFLEAEGRLIKKTEECAAGRLIPKGKGLEVGVGSGIFASALGVDYGIDPAEKMLRMARSRGVKMVLGIAEKLPFKEKTFDFLLFMFTLSFLADPLEAFREAHRVLEPNGKLIVCFIPKESPWGMHYKTKKNEGHDFYKHARFHTTTEVKKLLKKSDFRKTRTISTLFQKPDSVEKMEKPTKGIHKSAGLCCFEAIKD